MIFRDKEPTEEAEEWAGGGGGAVIHMQRRRPFSISPPSLPQISRGQGELMKRAGRPN